MVTAVVYGWLQKVFVLECCDILKNVCILHHYELGFFIFVFLRLSTLVIGGHYSYNSYNCFHRSEISAVGTHDCQSFAQSCYNFIYMYTTIHSLTYGRRYAYACGPSVQRNYHMHIIYTYPFLAKSAHALIICLDMFFSSSVHCHLLSYKPKISDLRR